MNYRQKRVADRQARIIELLAFVGEREVKSEEIYAHFSEVSKACIKADFSSLIRTGHLKRVRPTYYRKTGKPYQPEAPDAPCLLAEIYCKPPVMEGNVSVVHKLEWYDEDYAVGTKLFRNKAQTNKIGSSYGVADYSGIAA
jgi:hypothetical protein